MIPLTHQLLQLLRADRGAMEQALGLYKSSFQVSKFYQNEVDDALTNFWLPKTLANPGAYKWYTDWEIVLKSMDTSIGGIGFTGEPNGSGEVEIGYMIDGQHHNKGYATEALQLLVGWAFTSESVKCIIVHTYADNLPSIRILDKCGFNEIARDGEGLMTYKLEASHKCAV